MTARPLPIASALLALAATLNPHAPANAQSRSAIGRFYQVEPAQFPAPSFEAVRIERFAPHALVTPPPLDQIELGARLAMLTGQLLELPELNRIYITALDTRGLARLFEIDLLLRSAREIVAPQGLGPARGAFVQAAPDGSKIYVRWLRQGRSGVTDIYAGGSLSWLGSTNEFLPDQRVTARLEHRAPYMWTTGAGRSLLLVDTGRDQVVARFDVQRRLGPVYAAAVDAWRDLVLVQTDVGVSRYQVIDVVSEEMGPALDLDDHHYARAQLVMGGRLVVLVDQERGPLEPGWVDDAVATGSGAVFDLRDGRPITDFRFHLPYATPVSAVGALADPTVPGRLWLYAPGDDRRLDLDLPACDRRSAPGDGLRASIAVRWNPTDPLRYGYRLGLAASSEAAAGALAIEAARGTARTAAPQGWGTDLIGRDRWVRWSNGLGPAEDDVQPGTDRSGFWIEAQAETRPGIVAYRVQAQIGLARGCESDDRFLDNALGGFTVGPQRTELGDPRALAQRLTELLDLACEIGWIAASDCPQLRAAAEEVERARANRATTIGRFLGALAGASMVDEGGLVLEDAAAAIQESMKP